jgi:hypothetical protein
LLAWKQFDFMENAYMLPQPRRDLGRYVGSRLAGNIQIRFAPSASKGLLLAWEGADAGMKMLDTGLTRKKDKLFRTYPLGIHVDQELKPDTV